MMGMALCVLFVYLVRILFFIMVHSHPCHLLNQHFPSATHKPDMYKEINFGALRVNAVMESAHQQIYVFRKRTKTISLGFRKEK